jgi:hypothetical protein
MTSKRAMKHPDASESEARLDDLFRLYRAACAVPEASMSFLPNLWARIEVVSDANAAREASGNWFGRVAKVLVTAALAASAILGIMISSRNQSSAFLNATFVEALGDDHTSTLEPLHLDRIYALEPD